MHSKLERSTTASQAAVRRPTSPSTPAAASSAATAATVSVASPPGRTTTAFGGPAPAASGALSPGGTRVAQSADPGALWGAPPSREAEVQAFKKLPPAQQKARLAELKAEQAQLGQTISGRVGELDRRWRTLDPAVRAQTIRDFRREHHHRFEARTGREVDGLLGQVDGDQKRIDKLSRDLAKVPGGRARANVERREQLREQIAALETAQSETVNVAAQVIDNAGLKVERLAAAEQVIDPSAPKAGSGSALVDLVSKWVDLSWLFTSFSNVVLESTSERLDKDLEQQDHLRREARNQKDLSDLALRQQLSVEVRRLETQKPGSRQP